MRTRALGTGPLAGWVARLLLLGAVVFWWGGVLVPNLISLAFPAWLSPEAIPRDLNPDIDLEGRLANRVSAGALLVLAVLALASANASRRRSAGWISVSGWAVLGVTAAYLAWEEESDFHVASIAVGAGQSMFGVVNQYLWVILLSPLIAGFVLVMVGLIFRGRQLREVRLLLGLGMVVWLLALAHETSPLYLAGQRAYSLGVLLEETLEFGGALTIGLSAVVAMRARELGVYRRRVFVPIVVGSLAVVGLLGGLAGAYVFRAPVMDARPQSHIGTFHISLSDSQAVAQEFLMPAVPIQSFDLRLGYRDQNEPVGTAVWRVVGGGGDEQGPILRAGRLAVSRGKVVEFETIRFPPLMQPDGQLLTLLVQADVGVGSSLLVGATKSDRPVAGRLWINGEPAWSDQTLNFVAYSASEPTRSKLQAFWIFITSDWRWPGVLAGLALSLTLVTLIPVLLILAAWPRPRTGGIPSGLR